MKLPQIVIAGAAVAALAACSSAASSSSAAAPSASSAATSTAAAAPALSPPATASSLGPLTIGDFPDTTDGNLAKGICEQWSGLRQEYADRLATDSSYQLNQWFSGPDWAKEYSEANQLGDDPAYGSLETALGVATVGDDASTAAAAAVDKACEDAD